ncbi:cytochrome b [Thalassovita sp.]|jgi:cytochrome b561|uniref:cytochrome b n=1 Tax=Thalassovita sp. TaxID=1979401 RepID=UPI003B590201
MPTHYSRIQIALHWAVFLLIAFQFVAHDAMEEAWEVIEKGGTAAPSTMAWAHVGAGMLVLAFAVWRLALRLTRGVPPLPKEEPPMMQMAAHVTHWALYALMILLPIGGGMAWFGGLEFAAEMHGTFAPVLMALFLLHVAGALYHQFVLKTNLMDRMRTPG